MTIPDYPLEDIIAVKKRRVEAAEKVVKEKEKALENEEKKLKTLEEARDKVKQHKDDKLQQLRDTMDTAGSKTNEIEGMKKYLDKVVVELQEEEEKVKKQKKNVENAKIKLEKAKEDLAEKRKGVEKLENHKKYWMAEIKKELAIIEAREEDEMGSIIYTMNKKRQNDYR